MKGNGKAAAAVFSALLAAMTAASGMPVKSLAAQNTSSTKAVTLRICNWEEYIDTGDWGEDETIDLPSGDIIGQNSMIQDFE